VIFGSHPKKSMKKKIRMHFKKCRSALYCLLWDIPRKVQKFSKKVGPYKQIIINICCTLYTKLSQPNYHNPYKRTIIKIYFKRKKVDPYKRSIINIFGHYKRSVRVEKSPYKRTLFDPRSGPYKGPYKRTIQ